MAITKQQRKKCEVLIYEYFDKLDTTKSNTEYYKKLFAKMSDVQFERFFKKEFPLRFFDKPFVIDPTMTDIKKSLDILSVPMTEQIYLPDKYISEDGKAVKSKKCIVGYVHMKRLKQMASKKNSMSTDISKRDIKTGRLLDEDKNAATSDREFETLSAMGLDHTIKELSRPRADSLEAKSIMYNTINQKGMVEEKDIPIDDTDSLSKNLVNVYFLSAQIYNNILNEDYLLPYTIQNKSKKIIREE